MLYGCATYRAGVALPDTDTPVAALAARGQGRLTWISLHDPAPEESERLAAILHLDHDRAALLANPSTRARLAVVGDTVTIRAGAARYDPDRDRVEIGTLTVVLSPDLLVTVTQRVPAGVRDLRARLEQTDTIARGAWPVVYAYIAEIVGGYSEVLAGLRSDVELLERETFNEGQVAGDITRRIYQLRREAIDFRQAAATLTDPLDDLAEGFPPAAGVALQTWATTRDRVNRVADRSLVVSDLLSGILTAYQTDVALRQNEDMRKISAWVAIAAVPTLLAGVYGMNFEQMPELGYAYGYPILLVVMATICIALYLLFRHKDWL